MCGCPRGGTTVHHESHRRALRRAAEILGGNEQLRAHLGVTEADLLRSYPTLRAEDLANAWSYYRSHRDEIDAQIHENENA